MKRKSYTDGLADDLMKKQDQADKLRSLAGRASGLTAFLLNKNKEDILKSEAVKKIPELKEKLEERKAFFDSKTIKSDNIRVLGKEIAKCDAFIDSNIEEAKLEDLKSILDWYYKTCEKYGF